MHTINVELQLKSFSFDKNLYFRQVAIAMAVFYLFQTASESLNTVDTPIVHCIDLQFSLVDHSYGQEY